MSTARKSKPHGRRRLPIAKATRQPVSQSPAPSAPVTTNDDPDEIVWGAAAIGNLIGRSERQAYYLLESKAIKGTRKIGGLWSARRSVLLAQWGGEL